MGTWGTALFSNDEALDAKDTYEDMLTYGSTPEEAERGTIEELEMNSPLTDHNAWLGLAYAEWRCGRALSEMVKNTAIEFIDNGGDLDLWESAKDRAKRENVLAKLREQLTSPLPKPKRLSRPRTMKSPWKIGDVVAVKMPVDNHDPLDRCPYLAGKYIMLQVVDIGHCKTSKHATDNDVDDVPRFIVHHWWGDDINQAQAALRNPYVAYVSRLFSDSKVPRPVSLVDLYLTYGQRAEYAKYPVIAHIDMAPFGDLAYDDRYLGEYHTSIFPMPHYLQRWISQSVPRPLTGVKSVEWLL